MKNCFPEITVLLVLLTFASCRNKEKTYPGPTDVVYSVTLPEVRLGDGVPLELDLYLRWKVEEPQSFFAQFSTTDTFNHMILYPRALELSTTVANQFPSVDSVFSSERELFLENIKENLHEYLGESGMSIKEVIISRVGFPTSYTTAMEKVGLQRQLLEAIRQQNAIDLEKSAADKKKAEADAQVAMAQAEADAKVAQINAKAEESRRKSQLAKAETEAQMTRKRAQAEADRNRLLAKAELEKKTDLKNLELVKKQELDDLEIEKSKKAKRADLESQMEFATVVQQNPTFANFLINRELASKVEIAVLPTGTEPTVFGDLLKQNKN